MVERKINGSKVTRNGQITLNKKLRDELGIKEGDYIVFQKDGKKIHLVPAEIKPKWNSRKSL